MNISVASSLFFSISSVLTYCDAFSNKNARIGIVDTTKSFTNDVGSGCNLSGMISKVASLSTASIFLSANLVLSGAPPIAGAITEQSTFSTSSGCSSNVILAAETSLDFSLPSYDTKMSGFGDGSEAFVKQGQIKSDTADTLMTDPGSDEKEKQFASMRKAEEARKKILLKKKAEQKAHQEEDKRRAAEKKKRDAERLKNIWNS